MIRGQREHKNSEEREKRVRIMLDVRIKIHKEREGERAQARQAVKGKKNDPMASVCRQSCRVNAVKGVDCMAGRIIAWALSTQKKKVERRKVCLTKQTKALRSESER